MEAEPGRKFLRQLAVKLELVLLKLLFLSDDLKLLKKRFSSNVVKFIMKSAIFAIPFCNHKEKRRFRTKYLSNIQTCMNSNVLLI